MSNDKLRAWCVHVLTMSGAVCGFLALLNITSNDAQNAIWWLIIALIIDGVDGSLARKFKVTEHLPDVDGATIDNIVDYFTYVIIPAYYIWWFGLVPEGWATPAAIAILMSSQYHFSDLRHKTHDNYFRGFPALWNLVVFGFYVFEPSPPMALLIVFALSLATFVPLKFVHPFRVERLRRTNLAVAGLGSLALIAAVATAPEPAGAAKMVIALATGYFLLVGIHRSLTERDEPEI